MGKKNRIASAAAVAAAASKNSRLIQNLRTVTTHLVKDAAECRKKIDELTSMAAERDIFDEIERDVFALVISSSVGEAGERRTAEMAAVTERERDLRKKAESAVEELNGAEIRRISMEREKNEKNRELAELKERLRSMEEAGESGNRWKKWIYAAAASAALLTTAALVTHCCKGFFSRVQD